MDAATNIGQPTIVKIGAWRGGPGTVSGVLALLWFGLLWWSLKRGHGPLVWTNTQIIQVALHLSVGCIFVVMSGAYLLLYEQAVFNRPQGFLRIETVFLNHYVVRRREFPLTDISKMRKERTWWGARRKSGETYRIVFAYHDRKEEFRSYVFDGEVDGLIAKLNKSI